MEEMEGAGEAPKNERNLTRTRIDYTSGTELSGLTLIYLMAIGLQIFVLLFIFAKRQIMRFAWGGGREPHASIGLGASTAMKQEIYDNIRAVAALKYEPQVGSGSSGEWSPGSQNCRMEAMMEIRRLDQDLDHAHCKLTRPPGGCFFEFLKQIRDNALTEFEDMFLARFAVLYEWARCHPKNFGENQLQELRLKNDQLRVSIQRNRQLLSRLPPLSRCDYNYALSRREEEEVERNGVKVGEKMALSVRKRKSTFHAFRPFWKSEEQRESLV